MSDTIERELDYQVLLFAVQRQIFCPVHDCGAVLDVADASLLIHEDEGYSTVMCTRHIPDCFEPASGCEWYRLDEGKVVG